MPVMNGIETHREIKKRSPRTVVIMVTAYRVEELIQDALKDGVYAVLDKPLDLDKILKMVERSQKGGALILVVDDDPYICETLRNSLEERGYSVSTSQDGEQAVEIVKERPKDVIFIDLKLPLVNGLMVYLEIKKVNPDVVTVMMTAYKEEMQEVLDQALAHGAYACLHKPFDLEEVAAILEEIAGKKKRGK